MDSDEVRGAARVAPDASWTLKLPFLCARPGNVGVQIDAFRARELLRRPRCGQFTARFLGIPFESSSMENHARVVERTGKRARIVADRLARLRARQQELLDDTERRQRRRGEREAARQRKRWLHHQSLKRREQQQREDEAAQVLQRCARGMLGRREWDARRRDEAHGRAARTLQRVTRDYVRRQRNALEREKECRMQAAAAVLQRQARKRLAVASRKPHEKLRALESPRCAAAAADETEQVSEEDAPASPEIGREISLDLLFSDSDSEPTQPPRRPVSIKRVGGGFRATAFTPRKSPPPLTRPRHPDDSEAAALEELVEATSSFAHLPTPPPTPPTPPPTTTETMLQLFAPSQEYFAAVSEDNRLRVWDVSSGALQHDLRERDHLSYKYTCITWTLSSPLLKKSAKRAKASGSAAPLGLVALGTSAGAVVVWDLQKGEVVQTLASDKDKDAHGAAVTDVAFNSQGSLLYSSSSEKHVLEWNVKDGAVTRKFRTDGAHKLAVSANDEVLAVGGSAIRTFDLASGKKARKLVAGLSSSVSQLLFSACARFLFSSTVGGRFVNMYDLAATESDEPAVNFSMPSAPVALVARADAGRKKSTDVLLAAVATSGSLFVWTQKYKSGAKSTKPVAPDSKSVVADSGASASAGVLAVQASAETKTELLVVRGSLLKPVFERVSIVDEQRQLKPELAFAAISEHLLLAGAETASKKLKLAAEAAEKETARVPTLAERGGLAKALDVVDASAGFEDLAADGADDNDLTLAERVEALRERVENDLAAELVRADASELAAQGGEKPDASSLSSVLEQALQSKDNAMLEYCLRTRDAKTIGNTIKRVSAVKVLELLEILVLKFEKSPGRCARLCPWIRSILLHHTAYLMTQPDLVQSLSALYQILENRLKVHDQLQKLAGRLSLVIGQVHEAAAAADGDDATGPAATGDAPRAKIVYREGDDDEEDAEDADDADKQDDEDEEEEDEDEEEDDDEE
ncbi:hypothetical protein PybrP1_010340 [[Pythium] brassicae (nom. inval.)]|nr:hypothetical protein PybrP1_010340 [[Pythium] brassicae (nom. inval.)]